MIKKIIIIVGIFGFFLNTSAQNKNALEPKFETHYNIPIDIVKLAEGHYFIDFGNAFFGTLSMYSKVAQKDSIIVYLGEALAENNQVNRKPKGTIRYQKAIVPKLDKNIQTDVLLTADKRNTGPRAIVLPEYFGVVMPFRYVEIENLNIPIEDLTITQKAFHYQFNDEASYFTSSDTILNQIWDLCKHTIKATTFSGYYVDGDRERIPYEADAYINQLSHYAFDSEYSLAKRTNAYFIDHPTWPTEWILHTAKLFYYDYLYTGDTELLTQYYDQLKSKTLVELAREDGLISTNSPHLNPELITQLGFKNPKEKLKDIVDWPKSERDDYEMVEINTVVNAFYFENLQMMSFIAKAIGKTEDAMFYDTEATRIKNVINTKLFDASKGIYIDGEGTSHSSLHANMFPLAFGIVPEENRSTVVDFIKTKGMACSVYGVQYLLEGLYKANEAAYAMQLITDISHKRTWWNMIESGATMTLEAWDIEYKPNLDWNHAWGTAPANIISRNMWGITPTNPGFHDVDIAPQLSGLSFTEITVPTINGPIYAKFKRTAKSERFDIEIPKAIKGRFKLTDKTFKKISLNGKPIKYKEYLKLNTGHHSIEIVF